MSEAEWKAWPIYVQRKKALQHAKYRNAAEVRAELGTEETIDVKEIVDWIYGVLSILDSKASVLMRLNGVQIAASAFVLGMVNSERGKEQPFLASEAFDELAITWSAVLSSVSIFLCLFVVRVSWAFLDRVDRTSDSRFDFTNEIRALITESERRQSVYRIAWYVSLCSSFLFLADFVRQGFHVTFRVLGGS
ncbi:hypothetical protein K2X89_05075 [Myxococcota bacterium]|nr:hypothetical protein [Myxococcota bacterium]